MAFKILSLDGGGTWALLQALALETIYGDIPGKQILSQFDLVTANSGGSIVLAGLLADHTPSQLRDLFLNKASTIFRPIGFFDRVWNLLGQGAKWSTQGKHDGLAAQFKVLGSTKVSELQTRVLIPAFDYDRDRATFFRSYTSEAQDTPSDTSVLDAVNASSTAPVLYFDLPAVAADKRRYWDGAIAGYNNPVMAGLIEAVALKNQPTEVIALSLGTGTFRLVPIGTTPAAPSNLMAQEGSPNPLADIQKLAGAINDDPPDAASYAAYVMMGNDPAKPPPANKPPTMVRLTTCIQPTLVDDRWIVPPVLSADQFQRLGQLHLDAVAPADLRLLEAAGLHWLAGDIANQPVRSGPRLTCQVGFPTFPKGHAAWRKLAGLPNPPPPTPTALPT
jgi:hypothetical protein